MAERMQIERKDEFREGEGASITIRRCREEPQMAPTDTTPAWTCVGGRASAARLTSGSCCQELSSWLPGRVG